MTRRGAPPAEGARQRNDPMTAKVAFSARRAQEPPVTAGWLFALGVVACGGEPPMPSHPDPMRLSPENARPVAAALWLGHAVTTREDLVSAQLRDLLYAYLPLLAYRPNELPIEIGCGEAGSVTVGGEVARVDAAGQSVGDRATADFVACKASYGSLIPETANGSLSVEVSSHNADERVLVVGFEALSIEVANSGPLTQDGIFTLTESTDSSTTTLATELFTVSGRGLTRLMTDYVLRLRLPRANEYLLELAGTQSGGELAGALSFATTTPFHGRSEGHPVAGRLEVLGAESTSLVLEAQPDGDAVVLTVNGSTTIETTWFELEE